MMRSLRNSPRVTVNRRGLSLLELLLSIGLGLLLIGGIYAALDQSARRTTIGRVEVERIQIARAVLRRIELDLRATMFSPDTAISDSEDAGAVTYATTETSEDGTTTTDLSDSGDEEWTGSLGIRGTVDEIWIDLSHIRRPVEFANIADVTVSDQKTVTYFLSGSGRELDAEDETDDTFLDEDGIGLARSEGDRSVLRALNSTNGSGTLPGPTQVLAPEINQLKFRYFDGLTWYEEWDSTTNGMLPRAVEVVIGFEPPGASSGYLATSAVSASTETFRMVVAIPVSDPLPAEDY